MRLRLPGKECLAVAVRVARPSATWRGLRQCADGYGLNTEAICVAGAPLGKGAQAMLD